MPSRTSIERTFGVGGCRSVRPRRRSTAPVAVGAAGGPAAPAAARLRLRRAALRRGAAAVLARRPPRLRRRLRCAAAAARRRLLPAPAPARLARRRLRRGQVVGERARDLLDRAEPLAGRVEQLCSRAACSPRPRRAAPRRPRAAAPSRRGTSLAAFSSCRWPREFASAPSRRLASGNSALARRSCALRVACASLHVQRARICPARPACPRRSRGAACGRRAPVLLPRRRLRDERDEIVEVGPVDPHRDAVGARSSAAGGSGSPPRTSRGTSRAPPSTRGPR